MAKTKKERKCVHEYGLKNLDWMIAGSFEDMQKVSFWKCGKCGDEKPQREIS